MYLKFTNAPNFGRDLNIHWMCYNKDTEVNRCDGLPNGLRALPLH